MASLDEIKGILKSVNSSTMTQVSTLKSIINVQKRIDAGSNKFINNSNLLPDTTSMKDTFEELITLGKEQIKFLENIFKIQYEINEREKEALRLAKRPITDTSVATPKEGGEGKPAAVKETKKESTEPGFFEDILGIPTGLMAAAAALGLAFAGLRGWEVTAIKYVKDALGSIGNSIVNGVKNIKNGILSAFGMDVDGKPLPNSVLDNITKNPIMQKLTNGLSKILTPFKMMGDYITGLFSGGGGDATTNKAVKFLSEIGENVGAFAKTVGKILKPIGILFSAFDGVMAFMNTEGDLYDKFTAGIGAALSDFIGAPLDLLKSVIAWGISKLGFENAAEYLESFSFETIISDMFSAIFTGVKGALAVVGDLFTFGEEDKTALGLLGKLTDLVYAPVNMAINFVRGLFGFEETEEPFKLQDWITKKVTAIWDFFKEIIPSIDDIKKSVLTLMPDWLRKMVGAPERTSAEIVDEKMLENKAELEAARDRVARSQAGEDVYWRTEGAGQKDDLETINRLSPIVEAPNPELEALQAEKIAVDTNLRPDRLEGIFAEQQAMTQHLERLDQITGGEFKTVQPIDANTKPVVGRMIPNLDMPKEVAPLAFKTPSRADVIKSAAAAAAESAAIIEKPYSDVMQEEQTKSAGFMNMAEVIAESTKEQNTNNVNYAPMTDASSKTYVGGSSTTNIYSSNSSKNDVDYYFAH